MAVALRQPLYCPILRAKRGEIQALGALSPYARRRIRPLIDIPKQKDNDKKDLFQYLCGVVRSLPSTWGTGHPLYLDMSLFSGDLRIDDVHPIHTVFDIAAQAGLVAIPVTGTQTMRGPEPDYVQAVANIANQDNRGLALRIEFSDITKPNRILDIVEDTRRLVAVAPEQCDVFMDLEAIDRLPKSQRDFDTLFQIIQAAVRSLSKVSYRTVVICGSSIPERVDKRYNQKPCRVDRVEFNIWKALAADGRNRPLAFGDYGITYPFQSTDNVPVEPPSRIRLSTSTEHVLYRSTPDGYQDLRERVTREPPALTQADSVGKRAIFGLGHGFTGEGRATDWVTRDMNAHIESTLSHIARTVRRTEPLQVERPEPWLQEGLALQSRRNLDDAP